MSFRCRIEEERWLRTAREVGRAGARAVFVRPERKRRRIMGRKYIDCREHPSESNCTVTIAADTESELLEAAVQHAVAVHGHQDTPEFRDQMRQGLKEGTPAR